MPLHIIHDDLTTLSVDAIVNPTNPKYHPTGGLDLAIHEAAGEGLSAQLKTFSPLSVGEVRESDAFSLSCRYILHTVGPIWQGGDANEEEQLTACYRNALMRAFSLGCESIAFPLIASGAHGYPKTRVMKVATAAIADFLCEHDMTVYISIYSKAEYVIDRRLYIDLSTYLAETVGNLYTVNYCANEAPPVQKKRIPKANMQANRYIGCFEERRIDDFLNKLDRPFSETLFALIDERGITDVECYKRANVDKKTFSKIKCNPDYRPSKLTAISFAIGLHLTLAETESLLATLGFCLSKSSKFDLIILYFLTTGHYNTIHDVNEVLYQFDQVTLGC